MVEEKLRQDWSPEQIAGRFKEEGIAISHERIYQYIYADKRVGGNLWKHLRCQKKRRKRVGDYDRRGKIPNRKSIDDRQIDTLILGCTHYPVVKKIIHEKIGKKVNIIDSSISTAEKVKNFIEDDIDLKEKLAKNAPSEFYVSDLTDQFKKTAEMIFKKRINLKEYRL